MPHQLSDRTISAIGIAFRDPLVAQGVEEFLISRKADLETKLHKSAIAALHNPDQARPAALMVQGALVEIEAALEVVRRFVNT